MKTQDKSINNNTVYSTILVYIKIMIKVAQKYYLIVTREFQVL